MLYAAAWTDEFIGEKGDHVIYIYIIHMIYIYMCGWASTDNHMGVRSFVWEFAWDMIVCSPIYLDMSRCWHPTAGLTCTPRR